MVVCPMVSRCRLWAETKKDRRLPVGLDLDGFSAVERWAHVVYSSITVSNWSTMFTTSLG